MQWTRSVQEALLWHQDCNDLMFCAVFKGLEVCTAYNSRERKINHVYLSLFLSEVLVTLVPA